MADEPENLILRILRAIDEKLDTALDRLHDLRAHVSSREDQPVGVRTDLVRLEHRIDHFEQRLQRVGFRLDLTEA